MTVNQWIQQVTRLATSTRIQSMRSVCSSPGQGRVALDLLGQHSEQEQSVQVSVGTLGLVTLCFWVLTCSIGVYQVANELPQRCQHPV